MLVMSGASVAGAVTQGSMINELGGTYAQDLTITADKELASDNNAVTGIGNDSGTTSIVMDSGATLTVVSSADANRAYAVSANNGASVSIEGTAYFEAVGTGSAQARAIRNNGGSLLSFDGDISLRVSADNNFTTAVESWSGDSNDSIIKFSGNSTIIDSTGKQKVNTIQVVSQNNYKSIVEFSADRTIIKNISSKYLGQNWANIGVVDGENATLIFSGKYSELLSQNTGYTAQVISLATSGNNGYGNVVFSGDTVKATAISDYGANIVGARGVITISAKNVDFDAIITDSVGASNAIGILSNNYLNITKDVDSLNINVYGSGTDAGADGTAGIYAYSDADINAKNVNIKVVSGKGVEGINTFDKNDADAVSQYSTAYGVRVVNSNTLLTTGQDTKLNIFVDEGYKDAVGLSFQYATGKLNGNTSVSVSGITDAKGVSIFDSAKVALGSGNSSVLVASSATEGKAYGIWVKGADTQVTTDGIISVTAEGSAGSYALYASDNAQISLGSAGKQVSLTAVGTGGVGIQADNDGTVILNGDTAITADSIFAGDGNIVNNGNFNVTSGTFTNFTGTFTQAAGTTSLGTADFGGKVNVSGGDLNVSHKLDLTHGSLTVSRGNASVAEGGSITFGGGDSLTINGGAFVADATTMLNTDFSALEDVAGAVNGVSGNLNLRLNGEYTVEQYNKAKNDLLAGGENAQLAFVDGTLKVEEGETLVAGATGSDGSLSLVTGPVMAGDEEKPSEIDDKTIDVVPDKYVMVVEDDAKKELLAAASITTGSSSFAAKGLQIRQANAESVALNVDGTSEITFMGDDLGSTGVINEVGEAVATTATIDNGATLNMGLAGNTRDQGLTLTEATVEGTLNANGGVAGTTSEYAINTLHMNDGSKVNVLNSTMHIGEFNANGGTMFVDPAYVQIDSVAGSTFGTQLLVGAGSIVNIGGASEADMRQAMEKAGMSVSPNFTVGKSQSVLAVGTPMTLTTDGKIVVDATVTADGKVNGAPVTEHAYFGEDSLLIVDAGRLSGSAAITAAAGSKVLIKDGARLELVNATRGDVTILEGFASSGASGITIGTGWGNTTSVENADRMLSSTLKIDEPLGSVIVTSGVNRASDVLPGLDSEWNPVMAHLWDNGLNDVNADALGVRFLSRAANAGYIADAAKSAATIESAARMAFAGAVPQMTRMASDAATNAVVNRLGFANPADGAQVMDAEGKIVDRNTTGFALWVAPLWQNQSGWGMEAGNLDYGFNGNLGGVSLGADYTFENAIRAGITFNIGGGYAESSGGDLNSTQNNMSFWGLGAYVGWNYQNFGLMADVAYTSTWNELQQDLEASMGMGDLEADVQASAISAGLRAEYKLETSVLDVIPHIGVRYMSLNTWGYDVESRDGTILEADGFQQNIWTFPVGVTFSKDLQLGSGWAFTPSLDFTVIPAAGDIKARHDVQFTGAPVSAELETQMMDYLTWQGGVGLELGNDNMSIGVNYTLQTGQNSTGHGLFGSFRYEF